MAAEQTHVLLLLLGGGIYFFFNFSGGVLSFLSAPETEKKPRTSAIRDIFSDYGAICHHYLLFIYLRIDDPFIYRKK